MSTLRAKIIFLSMCVVISSLPTTAAIQEESVESVAERGAKAQRLSSCLPYFTGAMIGLTVLDALLLSYGIFGLAATAQSAPTSCDGDHPVCVASKLPPLHSTCVGLFSDYYFYDGTISPMNCSLLDTNCCPFSEDTINHGPVCLSRNGTTMTGLHKIKMFCDADYFKAYSSSVAGVKTSSIVLTITAAAITLGQVIAGLYMYEHKQAVFEGE